MIDDEVFDFKMGRGAACCGNGRSGFRTDVAGRGV